VAAVWVYLIFSRFMYNSDPTSSKSKTKDRLSALCVIFICIAVCGADLIVGETEGKEDVALSMIFGSIVMFFGITVILSYIQLAQYHESETTMWRSGGLYSIPLMIRSVLQCDRHILNRVSQMFHDNPRQFIVGCCIPVFNAWFAGFVFFAKDKFVLLDDLDWRRNASNSSPAAVNCEGGIGILSFDTYEGNRGLFHFAYWNVSPANQLAQTVAAVFALGFYSAYYAFYRRLLYGLKAEAVNVERQASLLRAQVNDIELMAGAWILDESEIELHRVIAQGAYGKVHYGCLRSRYEVAIKLVLNSSDVLLENDDEIRFLQRARHPRLVMFLGCGYKHDQDAIFLVLEYCDMGTLQSLLYSPPGEPDPEEPSWSTRLQILDDVSEGMSYLHNIHGSIHRDLKSANCLLSRDTQGVLRGKVADFGLSRFMRKIQEAAANASSKDVKHKLRSRSSDNASSPTVSDDKDRTSPAETMTAGHGTPLYMSPELVATLNKQKSAYTQKIDCYAFAIIMWECLMRKLPWSDFRSRKGTDFMYPIFEAVEKGERPRIGEAELLKSPGGGKFITLMRECWAQNPEKRPPFNAINICLKDIRGELFESRRLERKRRHRSMPMTMINDPTDASKSDVTESALPLQKFSSFVSRRKPGASEYEGSFDATVIHTGV